MIFTDRLLEFINQMGITKNKLFTDIGINHNSFGDWTSKNQIPNGETLSKIADYFNTSVDYLLGKTDNPRPIDTPPPVYDDEALELMRAMNERPELKTMFKTSLKAKKADVEFVDTYLNRVSKDSEVD